MGTLSLSCLPHAHSPPAAGSPGTPEGSVSHPRPTALSCSPSPSSRTSRPTDAWQGALQHGQPCLQRQEGLTHRPHSSQSSFENTGATLLAAWVCFASTNRSEHLAALAPAEGFAPYPPAVPSSPPQPPKEAGQHWGPAWPQTLFPVLCSASGFSRLVQQRSLFRQAKHTAHICSLFF